MGSDWVTCFKSFEPDSKIHHTGSETSSTTSFFALYGLALNQELQDKTRSEIQAVIDKHDGEITYDAMQDMKHLAMVVDGS